MKKVLVAAVLAAGVAGVAAADVKLEFSSGEHLGGDSSIIKLTDLSGELTGFTISYYFEDLESSGAWASDAAFVLNGAQYGGYDLYLSTATTFSAFWPWDGIDSAPAGVYGGTIGASGTFNYGDSYTFEFGNGYSFGDAYYKDVTVTLHGVSQVPAPGAIALLGLAGLVGRRRRA
jgi:MYXO-CTERM domain-containing protein